VENPFGIAEDEYLIAPILADIDGDGDLDMLAGSYFYGYDDYYYTIQYYENTGTAGSPSFAAPLQDPFGLTGVEDIVVPELADIDLDGDLDLFLGSYYGITIYHENIGTRTDPHFSGGVAHPFGIPAFNYIPVPRLADIDDDGDMDLFIEDYYEGVIFFENTSC
jgi:hypothetical protein